MTATPPATPPRGPSPKAEMQGGEMAEAVEAARRILDWDKRTAIIGDPSKITVAGALVKDALASARALLSAPRDASRDDVLEEAAKVADREARPSHQSGSSNLRVTRVARAIRALKEKPHHG